MQFSIPEIPLKINPDDYMQDGLLHCGKCHTPKQCVVKIFGVEQIKPCLCVCGVQECDRRKLLEQEKKHLENIQNLRKNAFPDSYMQEWKFDSESTIQNKYIKQGKQYVKNFQSFFDKGRGLLLCGNVGTGKTYIACCIANAIIDLGKSVIVSNFADISNELFSAYDKEQFMERFKKCILLVIDDFSLERDTQYMNEIVYNVIDTRYRVKRPLIVTTNLSIAQIKNPNTIDKQRVYSRILEMCIPITVIGDDMRITKARENYKCDMNILNGIIKCEEIVK